MYQLIIVIHILLGLGVIGLVLMQQGKGADAGASFGSGSSGSVFGAQGAASFLSRSTAVLATLFFCTSLSLAIINGHKKPVADIMSTPVVKKDNAVAAKIDASKTVVIPDVKTPVAQPAPAMITPEKPASLPTTPDVQPTNNALKVETAPAIAKPEEKPAEVAVDKKPAAEIKPENTKPVEHKKPVEKAKPASPKKSVEKAKPVKENSHVEKKPTPAKASSHHADEKKK